MISALSAILEVLKVPFVKELASDELSQVPNMPMVFNALCLLLKSDIPIMPEDDIQQEELEFLQQFE